MHRRDAVNLGLPLSEVEQKEGGILWMPIAAALGAAALPGISNIFKGIGDSIGKWVGSKIYKGKGIQGVSRDFSEGMGVVQIGDVRSVRRPLPPNMKFGTGMDANISLPSTFNPSTSYPFMRGGAESEAIVQQTEEVLKKINDNREAVINYVRDNMDDFKDAKDLAIKIGRNVLAKI